MTSQSSTRSAIFRNSHFTRCRVTVLAVLVILFNVAGAVVLQAGAGASGNPLTGTGSSFAAPAVESWVNTVTNAPYNLSLSYADTNSGDGRYEFANQLVDWAVTDIGYEGNTGNTPPSFAFDYVPIVGEGIPFMYHIPGLTQQLKLTSYTACGLLTGSITHWDSPSLAAANPGVTLPNLPVVPVTESDSAVTNFAMEQWCIAEQPALWTAFVHQQESQSGGPTDGVTISATSPNQAWPGIRWGLGRQSTAAVAGDVEDTSGAIGGVPTQDAVEDNFDGPNTDHDVALVENASGDYTAPTPIDGTSALTYATPEDNGTQDLDFNGLGANVYNPSTFSYLLTPTTGWSSADGQTMSAFINYALTLGQQIAPTYGYGSVGQPLEHFGINEVAADVPGSVSMTAAEQAFYNCGDLTPADAAAGNNSPSCGSSPPPNTPEAPYAVALPVLALAGLGGVFMIRRRPD